MFLGCANSWLNISCPCAFISKTIFFASFLVHLFLAFWPLLLPPAKSCDIISHCVQLAGMIFNLGHCACISCFDMLLRVCDVFSNEESYLRLCHRQFFFISRQISCNWKCFFIGTCQQKKCSIYQKNYGGVTFDMLFVSCFDTLPLALLLACFP